MERWKNKGGYIREGLRKIEGRRMIPSHVAII
jgi:hypothetical protein